MKLSIVLVVALFAVVLVFGCIGGQKAEKEEAVQTSTVDIPKNVENIDVNDIDEPALTSDEDDTDLGEVI